MQVRGQVTLNNLGINGARIEDMLADELEPAVASDAAAARPLLVVDAAAASGADTRRAIYCQRPHPEFKPLLLTRLGEPAGT